MALPLLSGSSLPSVDDCPQTSPFTSFRWLACLGISAWFASESPAGFNRNPRLLCIGTRKPQREMGLAGAAVAERDDVLAAGDVFAAGALQHQDFVERRQSQEVE